MSDFLTVAGTKLYVSTAAPAAQTSAAFGALTWTEVGSLTQIPSVRGKTFDTSELPLIGDPHKKRKKGSYTLPDAQFQCAWVEDDTGQEIVRAAEDTNDILSFKVEKQDGALRYFTAQVMEFLENNGGSNEAVIGQFTLLRQTNTISASA
jgi:hypothetical protein